MVATAIMGVATIGGAAIGASANRSAARTAAGAADRAADQNDRLVRDQMARADQYTAGLTPYAQVGASELARQLGLGVPVRSTSSPGQGAMPNAFLGSAPAPDFNAYLQANPDVMDEYQQEAAMGTMDALGIGSPQEFAQWHYNKYGRDEGRPLPMTQPMEAQAPADMGGGAEGFDPAYYGDSGFEMPTFAPRPDLPGAPSAAEFFGDFEASPDYEFRRNEMLRGLNVARYARGVGDSGGTIRETLARAGNLASGEYGDWWNRRDRLYQTALGQYNIDAARTDARYDSDRAFNYGSAVDTRNFLANRFDRRTGDVMALTGIGTGAINTALGQGQNATNALIASNNSRADATGNAAIAGANSTNALLGQGLNAIGYFTGNRNGNALMGIGANNRGTAGAYG